MKLYTLGTGSCAVSASRYNSSSILETDNGLYVFDAGSPCDSLLLRAGLHLADVRAIFITHMHLDHIGGLPNLLRALSNCNVSLRYSPISIFLPESSGIFALKHWLSGTRTKINYKLFDLKILSPSDSVIYKADDLKIICIPTDHIPNTIPITYAYAVYHSTGNILVTGDLSPDLHDMPRCIFQEPFHTCLCEATHFDPTSSKMIFQELKCQHLIFHHVHTPWQSHEGASKFLSSLSPLPYVAEFAYDGARYSIPGTDSTYFQNQK